LPNLVAAVTEPQHAGPPRSGGAAGGRWFVLIAEDDDLHARVLTELVEAGGDFLVVGRARHGREAVELAEQLRPDVAVVDIRMPRLDGVAATRQIRAVSPATPVVLISGYDYEERALEAAEAGATEYIRKGRLDSDLLAALRAIVTRT
jgi:DNA-binding NarL/FixJ family response regulator